MGWELINQMVRIPVAAFNPSVSEFEILRSVAYPDIMLKILFFIFGNLSKLLGFYPDIIQQCISSSVYISSSYLRF